MEKQNIRKRSKAAGPFKIWGWDKKKRTMLRFVKSGDIFCFKINDGQYRFGRIITHLIAGHVVELFDYLSSSPEIPEEIILKGSRLLRPILIDTYGLFDRKIEPEGDWRITDLDGVYFYYGIDLWCKRVDVWGNEMPISEEETADFPPASPLGDFNIKSLLAGEADWLRYY